MDSNLKHVTRVFVGFQWLFPLLKNIAKIFVKISSIKIVINIILFVENKGTTTKEDQHNKNKKGIRSN